MQQGPFLSISSGNYLQGERDGDIRHEYVDGQIYAMAGAGENHNIIALNLTTELRRAARETDCRAFISDMKLRLAGLNRFVIPIFCWLVAPKITTLILECLDLALVMESVYEDRFDV